MTTPYLGILSLRAMRSLRVGLWMLVPSRPLQKAKRRVNMYATDVLWAVWRCFLYVYMFLQQLQ